MAELVDALDLGSSRFSCGGSSPPNRSYIYIFLLKYLRHIFLLPSRLLVETIILFFNF